MSPTRVGIIFGGPSREREISFAGGRTVYDNLDKRLFAPVPLFMDAHRRLILLDWSFVYKGTIRDFWPPVSHYPADAGAYQLSEESLGELTRGEWEAMAREIGRPVAYDELPDLIDLAFLTLHGVGGEDGAIQGALETLGLPYTGSGIPGCAIGMDKVLQKRLMAGLGFFVPPSVSLRRAEFEAADIGALYESASAKLGAPLVVRGANQGSSIGVTILKEPTPESFRAAVERALFIDRIDALFYRALDGDSRRAFVANISDLRHGIGFPMRVEGRVLRQPSELQALLDASTADEVRLASLHGESRVVLEGFLSGKEVSTIVVRRPSGEPLALLPTEIVKGGEVFDYRSKYLPGLSRKQTPANLPEAQLEAVRAESVRLFDELEFDVYARIDGFVSEDGRVALNDPNTTSGMLPSSFFFHQAAEIGLAPREFLTYIIAESLRERHRRAVTPNRFAALAKTLEGQLRELSDRSDDRSRVAVLLGGYSSERHISVESGRNIVEKLASSGAYAPTAVFVLGDAGGHRLFELPVSLLLKDNADDIRAAILGEQSPHPSTAKVREAAREMTERYADSHLGYAARELSYAELAERFDEVFIALHGRPGEDGEVQRRLEAVGMPYNGSGYDSSQLTINKYDTLRRLGEAGLTVTKQRLVSAGEFVADADGVLDDIAAEMGFPLIVKPVDDGCSSAVQKIRTREQLAEFLTLLLDLAPERSAGIRARLGIHPKDEIPVKSVALVEQLIDRRDADLFLEITGGLLTSFSASGALEYQVFEPSEALSTGEVLTLEEKFLAGEGQNITPARFAFGEVSYAHVAERVKATLGEAAELLGVEGYARVDAFVRAWADGRVETIVIEVNSLPGMTPATCIYHQAALEGYTPYQFIDRILAFGRSRSERHAATTA